MDAQTIHLWLRLTARVSFLFFLGAFVAAALFRLWPSPATGWLAAKRDRSILGFAASHTVHLSFIAVLAIKLGSTEFLRQIGWVPLVVGGTVYLFIYGLAAAAAFPNSVKPFRSPRFQAFALYLIWTIFALGFASRAVRSAFYLPFALAVMAALALRLLAAKEARKIAALSTASH